MNLKLRSMIGMSAFALLIAAPVSLAEEPSKPPMHMHESAMDQRDDDEVAREYKDEAAQLREKADSHRKLADSYKRRTPHKGSASYANVAKHCEKLARYYADAAKEAELLAAELEK